MSIIKRLVEAMEKHLIKIEMACFFIAIIAGVLCHIFNAKLVNYEFIKSLLNWVKDGKLDDLLDTIDRYALIVGGFSFFVEEWTEEDTENKVFLLYAVFSLLIARFLLIFNLQYLSLSLTCINAVIVSIPLLCFIYRNIVNSHRRDLRKG